MISDLSSYSAGKVTTKNVEEFFFAKVVNDG